MLRLLVESETQVPLLQSLTRPLAVNPQTRRYARNFLEEGTMSLSLEVDNITYVLGLRRYTDTTRPNINYCLTQQRPGDLPVTYASVDKIFNELGWKAEKTLDDICKDGWNSITQT